MSRLVRLSLILGCVVAIVWIVRAVDLGPYLNQAEMQRLVEAWEPYGAVVFMLVCALGVFGGGPELLIVMAGAPAFGPLVTFTYAWLACVGATTATFLITRLLGREQFQRMLLRRMPRLQLLDERLARHGFVTVLILRFVLILAPPLNWGLGATRVRLRDYVAGTALGIVPWLAIAVLAGPQIIPENPGDPWVTPRFMRAVGLLVAGIATLALVGRRLLAGLRATPPA
jgi:uncharacterized membrane protein YdjX (TVP38/TMEM64 family)